MWAENDSFGTSMNIFENNYGTSENGWQDTGQNTYTNNNVITIIP